MNEESIALDGLRTIAVGDRATARAVVVLLHGFMMRPEDLAPFGHSLGGNAYYLFPEGPLDVETGGRAWWRIDPKARDAAIAKGPRDFAEQDPPDLPAIRERLVRVWDEATRLCPNVPLVVGGFSQGGMLTADAYLHAPRPVAGMVLLSASRIAFAHWPPILHHANGLAAFVSHGRSDPDLAFATGEALKSCLEGAGAKVTWLPFDGAHEIPLVVWRGVRRFLEQVM